MKLRLTLFIAALIGSANSYAINMSDIGYETLINTQYSVESVPKYSFDATNEKVSFRGFEVAKTEDYYNTMKYIGGLDNLNDYQEKTLQALAFSVTYTLQNADLPESLSTFSKASGLIDVCVFSFPDKSFSFNAMRVVTIAIGEDNFKERFLMGSAELLRSGPDLFKEHSLFDILPYCGDIVGSKSNITL